MDTGPHQRLRLTPIVHIASCGKNENELLEYGNWVFFNPGKVLENGVQIPVESLISQVRE